MKKFFGSIQTLTILVLIILIILMRMCSGKSNPAKEPKVITNTIVETKYDTIKETIKSYIPIPGPVRYDTTYLYHDIDTAAILKDYFAEYTYNDTIDRDTVKIYINDKVTKNKIVSRDIKYEILYPTKIITIKEEHYINQREFYIGPRLGATISGQTQLSFIGIESVFRSKKNKTFSVAAGVNQNFGIELGLGLHWKLTK